ncbi:DUF421 domain-containing protein [Pontibacter harenae]|uniref:DUF421 domain-containing protein n=1 Tax=Pontibacter harenae TaxID=2894083 RepID=UPI001E57AF98|nr:YetF domain-containing protein [Pontibacter harenae]MCC9167701.1 DUF421 domain-containing protein [Pontibacter harenae]
MNSTDAELWDWMRILLGSSPPIFLIEVIIRVSFIYLLLMVSMRIMGKRMSALISRNEMIAMVSLAAAVGLPMQDPNQGLIPAVIVAIIVIGVQRIISTNTMKSAKFESLVVGSINALAQDGCLQLKNMERSKITRERLLTEFRNKEVTNLGKVQRAYLEANGSFTIYLYDEDEEREGLCILPDWDKEFLHELTVTDDFFACGSCGNVVQSQNKPEQTCDNCGHKEWFKAIRA